MSLQVITRREAALFARFADAVVAPAAPLPPVRQTDAVAAFDRILARSPRANRVGLRALLLLVSLALRALPTSRRQRALDRPSGGPVADAVKALRALAQLSYYGDDSVMRLLGYDADANVARGRALRRAEGRW